jgi:hypothetical protein
MLAFFLELIERTRECQNDARARPAHHGVVIKERGITTGDNPAVVGGGFAGT